MSFMQHIQNRRSIYAIGKNVTQTPEQIDTIVREAIKQSPSSFNSQSSRAVSLYGDSHHQFWEIVRNTLKNIVPEAAFAATSQKIDSFAAGFATILFYEDMAVIENLQQQFPLYADNFPVWAEHSTAIAQFATWTALSEIGIGASLQHYNPIVDAEVAETYAIPETWKLRAQLVLGSIEAPAAEKSFMDDAARFKTFL